MTDAERYRLILNSRIAQTSIELDKVYSGVEFQLVNAVVNADISDYDLQKNPALKNRIEELIKKLNAVTTKIIVAGTESSWALSNKKNDEMVHKIFRGKGEIPAQYLTKTSPQNDKAFSAFIERKTNGLNLSENVWKYNEGYKTQIENALQIGIGNGVSAKEMSKYLTQYLQNPTATIAEYDDKNISAQIPQSKKTQPGVYASPKKNAMRLARTEINMAYDTADYNRWQNLDFVVGFEVHTSGNHTTKDKKGKIIKIVDICDKLAGKYPKDFKFTGWHPQCRCYMTSILKSDDEQDDEDLAILRGEDPEKKESENTVKDVPEGFKQWIKENQERLEKSDSLPYFVRDNKEYFSEVDFKSVVKDQFEESKPQEIIIQKTAKEIIFENAKKRHDARTPEQIADIKKRWAEHEEVIKKAKHDEMIARVKERQQSRTPEEIKAIQDAWNERKHNNMLERVKARQASRTDEDIADIKARWKKHHGNIAVIKYGKKIANIAEGIYDLENYYEFMNAINNNDVQNIEKYSKSISLQLKELKNSQYIDNGILYAKRYSLTDVKLVEKSVSEKLKTWRFSSMSFDEKKKKLIFEIAWIEDNKKYNTWKIAQDAYRKILLNVEYEEYISYSKSKLSIVDNFILQNKRYKKLKKLAEDLRTSIAKKDSLEIIRIKMDALNKEYENKLTNNNDNKVGIKTIEDIRKERGDDFPKTLNYLNDAIVKYEQTSKYGEPAKIHKSEIERTMIEVFSKHDFGMNIECDSLLKVLDSKFKNTFEVGKSGGYLGSTKTTGKIDESHSRLTAAHKLFGLPSKNLKKDQLERNEYEKYGNLLDKDKVDSIINNTATQYGDIEIRFKKDKVICTWTAGDSLGLSYQPSLTTDPRSCSFDNLYKLKRHFDNQDTFNTDNLNDFKKDVISNYLELQYHGELTIDCIDSITLPNKPVSKDELDLVLKAKELNIHIGYVDVYKKIYIQL